MNFETIAESASALHADEADRFVHTHSLSINPGWNEIVCGACGHVHEISDARLKTILARAKYRCRECQSERSLEFDRYIAWEPEYGYQ